jgi:hypothetical protein
MIVYQSDKSGFLNDVHSGRIHEIIAEQFKSKLHRNVPKSELDSWRNSMMYMHMALVGDYGIPNDTGVCIEFTLPPTSKRIDFILTGTDENNHNHAIIIELKQWSSVEVTQEDGIVRTALGGGIRNTTHPSYQALSYAQTLSSFNEAVFTKTVSVNACAFTHNLTSAQEIRDARYKHYWEQAPVFLGTEINDLQDFIKRFIRHGDRGAALYLIQNGRIKPSKELASALSGMLKNKPEFVLLDDQKVVFERALSLMNPSLPGKQVFIVRGGPGTGKSVVAINLLVAAINKHLNPAYVSKNAAPRAVYKGKLLGAMTKSRYDSLFIGSGTFIDVPANGYDVLIVDEAHRLNEKSGLYGNLGENQIKEIISAAKTSVFFLDENQKVAMADIGSEDEIRHWAQKAHATVVIDDLQSQFRCGGSDIYMAWLDNTLGIRETAHPTLSGTEYQFSVVNSPNELFNRILALNHGNSARVVAGYCYPWRSKTNPNAMDIVFPEYGFEKQWNLASDGSTWIAQPHSVEQIGCIHTCQGLEVEHIGVIIGKDLVYRDGNVQTDFTARDRHDKTMKGAKSLVQKDPNALKQIDLIVRNTYRTLMTRGMKSCTVWCEDEALNAYLKNSV